MAFIAAVLIMHVSEVQAFWLLNRIFNEPLYNLRDIFTDELLRMKLLEYEFRILLIEKLPVTANSLENVDPVFYLYNWYMTMFTSNILPWDLVLRVW